MVEAFKVVDVQTNGLQLSVPVVIKDFCEFITSEIFEGLFRINGSLKKINHYYQNIHKYNKWLKDANIYDICSLLKKILITNYKFIDVVKLDLSQLNQFDDSFNWHYFNKFINNNLNKLNLNIFVYIINFMSDLLQHNQETKMSLLNFSIIFQPIFFTCDNLICLPNYINLLNFLLANKDNIKIDHSLVDTDYKLSLESVSFQNEQNDSLMYKFKSFKNKSIDSINDMSKRLPFGTDFKGYKLSNKSVEVLTRTIEEDQHNVRDEAKENEGKASSTKEDGTFKENGSSKENVDVDTHHSTVSGTVSDSVSDMDEQVETETETDPLTNSVDTIDNIGETEPKSLDDSSMPSPNPSVSTDVSGVMDAQQLEESEPIERYESAKNTLSTESSPSPQFDESFTESFQSLAPETKPRTHHFYNMHIKADESIDPLTVDPEVNKLVQLEDIDTKSFQFNIHLENSPTSSFHSLDSKDDQFDEYSHRNNSQDTNDTSFHSDVSKTDKTGPSSSSILRSQSSSISTHSRTSSHQPVTPPLPEPRVRARSSPSNVGNRRNSRILTRIESRLSTVGDRSSIIEKRKSFIKLFKNEGGIKLSLKLKSKSVY